MRTFIILLLVAGLASAATLEALSIDVDDFCDGTVQMNLVTVKSDGSPVENAFINVEDIAPWKKVTSGTANASGEFVFEGCGDTYNITASYGGYESEMITVALPACGGCTEPEPEPEIEEQNDTNVTEQEEPPPPPEEPDPPAETEQPLPPAELEEPAVTPQNEDPEEEAAEPQEKKPLPCPCPCAAGLILLPLLAIKART